MRDHFLRGCVQRATPPATHRIWSGTADSGMQCPSVQALTRSRVVRATFSLSTGLEPLVDRERKTLAEFSRTYLRSLETPIIVDSVLDGHDAEGRFAASVALGMRRAVMDRERHDR